MGHSMRGVKAKHLRKIARAGTQGKLPAELIAHNTNKSTGFHHPETTRAVYQQLKKYSWRFKRLPDGRRMLVPLTFNKSNQPNWIPKDENPLPQSLAS